MRKKPVKSTSVGSDLKRRIVKKQQGGVASYINVNEPVLQYKNDNWIELPDAFSEYNLPTKIKPHNEEPLPIAVKAVDTKEERAKADSERKPVKQNAFINGLRPIIEQTLKRRGLDTKWTDHLVAQAALESGWGKSESGKFNLSGIKGKGSEKNTKEYINGKMVNTRDSFRDYKDYNDWADNYINLLSNKRYGKAWTLSEDQFMPYIINAGYATDPNYISKYNKVLAEVKKYENGGRIRRFQNAGIIARDNTRMPTVIAPKLKEQPQIPMPNQTYLSQAPSKEIIENNNLMQRRRELGNTITQFGTNLLDALKIGMSFANPAAGMALGLSDAGISAANGDYVSGGVQAGLEMLPYIGKTVNNMAKVVTPAAKRFGRETLDKLEDSFYKTAAQTKIGKKFVMKQQDKAFKKGIDEISQMWNNSPDLSNYEIYKRTPRDERIKYSLNPDISRRIENVGAKPIDKPSYYLDDVEEINRFTLYDNKGNNHYIYKGDPSIKDITEEFKDTPNFDGYFTVNDGYNNLVVKRSSNSGRLYTPNEIRGMANHEATHLMQNNYGLSLDVLGDEYGVLNPNSTIGKKLTPFLNNKNFWASSGDEVQAELWRFRRKYNIGTRDLTNEEASKFVKENARLFKKDVNPNDPNLTKGIQMIYSLLPVSLGGNYVIQNEK